jgi:hypothetical protein
VTLETLLAGIEVDCEEILLHPPAFVAAVLRKKQNAALVEQIFSSRFPFEHTTFIRNAIWHI